MTRHISSRTPSAPKSEVTPEVRKRGARLLRQYADIDSAGDDPVIVRSRESLREQAQALGLRFVTVTIVEEPIPDPAIEALPRAERERIEAISHDMYKRPETHMAELERLVARHPHIPMLRNHLAGALNAAGARDQANELIAETARLFPTYVFGLCNHVLTLISQGMIDEARAIVETGPRGPLFVLSHVDPTREVFHISEAISHAAMVGHYMLASGRLEAAAVQLKILKQSGPDSSQCRSLASAMRRAKSAERLINSFKDVHQPRTRGRTSKKPRVER